MNRELEGLVALVTGAGSGIGRATALAFAREGARVVVSDIDGRGGEETVVRIHQAGGDAQYAWADVGKEADVVDLLDGTLRSYGRLDVAFNNAGISGDQGPLASLSEAQFNRVVAVNLTGVFLCMKHQLIQMERQESGSIINNVTLL